MANAGSGSILIFEEFVEEFGGEHRAGAGIQEPYQR
jgi:hypothetical protein